MPERPAECVVRVTRSLEQDRHDGATEHLVLGAVVEHREARRDVRLERELLEQAGAEGVNRLHLEPARRLQCGGEQRLRPAALTGIDPATPISVSAASRAASSSVIQLRSRSNTRVAMLAAAALVKVRHRMRDGSTPPGAPSSISRMTRWASTWVLPEPALAATNTEHVGSEASACRRRTASGIWRPLIAPPVEAAGERPLLDAGEVVVGPVPVRPHREHQGAVRHRLVVEPVDEFSETRARCVRCRIGAAVLERDDWTPCQAVRRPSAGHRPVRRAKRPDRRRRQIRRSGASRLRG